MTLKDMHEGRTADRRITGPFKNPRVCESLDEHPHTHPSGAKSRRMWAFFVVGWAAGTIGFVLLFFQ